MLVGTFHAGDRMVRGTLATGDISGPETVSQGFLLYVDSPRVIMPWRDPGFVQGETLKSVRLSNQESQPFKNLKQ